MAFKKRRVWTSQPQEVVEPASWLPSGSAIYTPPTQIVGTDGRALLGAAVTVAPGAYSGGIGIAGSASSSRLPIGQLLQTGADVGLTLVAQFVSSTTSIRYVAGVVADGTGYIEDFGVNLNSAESNSVGRLMLFLRQDSGGFNSRAGSTDAIIVQGQLHTAVWQWAGAGSFRLWLDGVEQAVTVNASSFTANASGNAMGYPLTLLNRNVRNAFSSGGSGLTLGLFARIPGTAYSGADLSGDPWGTLFAPQSIWVPVSAGGATTHATTGALAGAGGAIDGTAAHIAIHGTSGVLAGSGGTIDGAAARTRVHPTSGVLAGGGGQIDGAADHVVPGGTHDTSGALAGGGGAIDGTAAHVAIHGTSGVLAGAGGAVVGTAARVAVHDTSGALVGGGAVIEGRASGPQAQDNSGGWPIYHRKKKKKDDDEEELEPAVIEAVAVVPAPRRMVTLEKLIGKKAAAQVNEAQLSSQIRMLKRKRQDEELMLM